MEGAIAEDGALADLDGVFAVYVSELKPDFDAVLQAADWETRVEALRTSVAQAIHAQPNYRISAADLAAYIASDPRLAHLKGLGDAMDPGEIPPHLRRTGPQTLDVQRQAEAPVDDWDDDPPVNGVGIVEGSVEDWDDDAPAEPKPLFIPDMMQVAGIQDQDGAEIFGMSKSYFSMIRNRKRPWPGMKPDQIERLLVELKAHEQAIAALRGALKDSKLTMPSV